MRIPGTLILAVSLLSQTSWAAKISYIDEAKEDLVEARREIVAAVATRKLAELDPFLSQDVGCGFGGCVSKEQTIELLGLRDPASEIWDALQRALSNGGQYFEDGAFTAPYWFTAWPDGFDAFTSAFTPGPIPLRATANGEIIAVLNQDIVEILDPSSNEEVVRVKDTTTGKEGFVAYGDIVWPIGLRVQLVKNDGTWQITNFIQGD